MVYLNKIIDTIVLIDTFTDLERNSVDNQITEKLGNYLTLSHLKVFRYTPNSKIELFRNLEEIKKLSSKGMILHFIGHGGEIEKSDGKMDYVIGNKHYTVLWNDIFEHLAAINSSSNDGLIINTTIMCFGNNIFQLIRNQPKPYYAAIGSTTSNTLRAWLHNKEIYEKCLSKDNAEYWLTAVNNNLKESDSDPDSYELRYS